MNFRQSSFPLILSLCAFFVLLALINFHYGFGEDHDAALVLGHGLTFGKFGYRPTRALGYPFYDLLIYPLIFYGGENLAKFYSMILVVVSVLLFYKIALFLTGDKKRSFLAGFCFALHPLTIISGNSLTETSQGILLALSALYSFLKFCRFGDNKYLMGLLFFAALATATRQDYLCFSVGLFFPLLVLKRFPKWKIFFAACAYLLLTVGIYPLVYGAGYYVQGVSMGFLGVESFSRRLAQAFFGFIALLGLPALGALFYFGIRKGFSGKKGNVLFLKNPFLLFLAATLFFYLLRFVTLPVKLEYVFVLIPLLVLFCSKYLRKEIGMAVLAFALFLPNLVQIHFFERVRGEIQIRPGFSPGAIAQDRSGRLRIKYITSPEYVAMLRQAAEHFQCKDYVAAMTNWISKEAETGEACIIVPEERLRFWNKERLSENIDRAKLFKRRIIVYFLPDNRGWRQFIRFRPWQKVTLDDFWVYEG